MTRRNRRRARERIEKYTTMLSRGETIHPPSRTDQPTKPGEMKMDLQLKGKTALILGGSKGLGRGVADALAAEGVAVALVARGQEALDRAVSEISSRGAKAVGFAADLANWPSLEAAANAARKELGLSTSCSTIPAARRRPAWSECRPKSGRISSTRW